MLPPKEQHLYYHNVNTVIALGVFKLLTNMRYSMEHKHTIINNAKGAQPKYIACYSDIEFNIPPAGDY